MDSLVHAKSVAWTSDSTGAASASLDLNGVLLRVVTNPGSTAPTDNYDVTLLDRDGYDVLEGGGANRDTANTESIKPVSAATDSVTQLPTAVAGIHTLAIANAGASKTGSITFYYR